MKPDLPDGLHIAFDLGVYALKAVVVERTGGRDRITAIEEETLHPPGDFPGENEYRENQTAILKRLSDRLPVKTARSIMATFNSRELQFKIVELPQQVADSQLENVLSWEAKKMLSPTFRSEPCLYAYRPLRSGGTQFALSVVPLSHLRRFIEIFEAADLRLDGIYPESLTGLAVRDCLPNAALPALSLINVGHLTTHIHIFSGGDLKFYRHIPSGMGEVPDPAQPGEMEVYTQKIRFSFDYFRAVTKLGGIDEIQFLGGGICRPGFMAYSRDYFAPGRTLNLDLSSRFDITPVINHQGSDGLGLAPFLPAMTAFLAHLEASSKVLFASTNLRGRLRFMEDQERWTNLARTLPRVFAVTGLIVMALIFLWWRGEIDRDRLVFKDRLATAEMKNASLRTKLTQRRSQEAVLKLHERKALAPLLRDRLSAGEIMLDVILSKPESISLRDFEILPAGVEPSEETDETSDGKVSSDSENPLGVALNPEGAIPFIPSSQNIGNSRTFSGIGTGDSGNESRGDPIDNLGGEILFLRGTAGDEPTFLAFVDTLRTKDVIMKYRRITARKDGGKLRFSLEGELP
ncbi:MAG: hypothetical protein HQM09_00240 [Candidatus Riflebacteria bacterium]|nr:hypothetical protein [Candidatus Riflebacteria bacterium]